MDQTKFIRRLFDGKPIDLAPKGVKATWESGGTRRENLAGITVKCSHCKKDMNYAGLTKRLIVGATCTDCLERARLSGVQAG